MTITVTTMEQNCMFGVTKYIRHISQVLLIGRLPTQNIIKQITEKQFFFSLRMIVVVVVSV